MRFSVATSLLLFAGAVGSLAMASCSSPPASDDDEGLTDDEINGQDNRMGLRLIYDDASHSLRATVKQKLRAGEVLKLNVRRGRLSAESERLLDCGALPDAPAMPPVEDNTGAVASPSSSASGVAPARVVYQGPTVDSSLLVSVYDDAWIQGNITPVMLDRLARDGADSIVEACIVKGDRVRARVQTTVAYAWDEADPNLREMDIDRASFEGIHLTTGDVRPSPKSKLGVPIRSMEKYAEACVSELGEIPFFKKIAKGKYDTFDCRDFVGRDGKAIAGIEGALIPQAVHDADGKDVTPRACDAKNASRYDCFRTCDRPEWLSQSCEPGPTVATAKNDQGTHWTLLCRGAGPRDGASSVDELTHTKTFNDISMIGHNPKTGKTCFFQNKVFDGTNGAKIPHPADVQKSRDLWDAPKGHCMGCHSADAFVHSPWIDGADALLDRQPRGAGEGGHRWKRVGGAEAAREPRGFGMHHVPSHRRRRRDASLPDVGDGRGRPRSNRARDGRADPRSLLTAGEVVREHALDAARPRPERRELGVVAVREGGSPHPIVRRERRGGWLHVGRHPGEVTSKLAHGQQ